MTAAGIFENLLGVGARWGFVLLIFPIIANLIIRKQGDGSWWRPIPASEKKYPPARALGDAYAWGAASRQRAPLSRPPRAPSQPRAASRLPGRMRECVPPPPEPSAFRLFVWTLPPPPKWFLSLVDLLSYPPPVDCQHPRGVVAPPLPPSP